MSEWGCQVVLSDAAWADLAVRERSRRMMVESFAAKGLYGAIEFDEARRHYDSVHDSDVYPDCPWEVFDREHPGADRDEYPFCEHDEHWLPGGWFNEINAYIEVADEDA